MERGYLKLDSLRLESRCLFQLLVHAVRSFQFLLERHLLQLNLLPQERRWLFQFFRFVPFSPCPASSPLNLQRTCPLRDDCCCCWSLSAVPFQILLSTWNWSETKERGDESAGKKPSLIMCMSLDTIWRDGRDYHSVESDSFLWVDDVRWLLLFPEILPGFQVFQRLSGVVDDFLTGQALIV